MHTLYDKNIKIENNFFFHYYDDKYIFLRIYLLVQKKILGFDKFAFDDIKGKMSYQMACNLKNFKK